MDPRYQNANQKIQHYLIIGMMLRDIIVSLIISFGETITLFLFLIILQEIQNCTKGLSNISILLLLQVQGIQGVFLL